MLHHNHLHPVIINSLAYGICSYAVNFHYCMQGWVGLYQSHDAMVTLPVLNPLGDSELAGDKKLPAAAVNCYGIT